MTKNSDRNQSEKDMARDNSLLHRIESCAEILMRAKGLFRDRLIDLNLELGPLREVDFPEGLAPSFLKLVTIVEKNNTGINTGFGHFHDPTPKERDEIAELVLTLYRATIVAETKHN